MKQVHLTRFREGYVIVQYTVPCPPIQIYKQKEDSVVRILYFNERLVEVKSSVEDSIRAALDGLDSTTFEKAYQNATLEDCLLPFKLEEWWHDPDGGYD